MAMPARRYRGIFFSRRVCRRVPAAPFGFNSSTAGYGHGTLGSKVNGSSLPHFSGTPDCRSLAVRALCRWQASWIICAVAPPLGAVAEVVKSPARGLVAVDVVGAVVCADADRPETASTAAMLAGSISARGMCMCFIALLLNLEMLTA